MIYLLLGNDDFSKKEFLDELQAVEKLEVSSFIEPESSKEILQTAMEVDLFGGKKMLKIYDLFSRGVADASVIDEVKNSPNLVIFLETKLDKRKAETKALLGRKELKVKEFNTLTGLEFKNWLNSRVSKYELNLSGKAMELFLQKIGFASADFGDALYSLWQVDSELKKLKEYAGGSALNEKDIDSLVSENLSENVFKITNAIGDKNQPLVVKALTEYLDRLPGDEKAKVISLSGLLAEQFRNILIIKGGGESGFASGKLFVYQKLAANFDEKKVLDALRKMELLDQEVKTTNGPAGLQMLMIIESLLK